MESGASFVEDELVALYDQFLREKQLQPGAVVDVPLLAVPANLAGIGKPLRPREHQRHCARECKSFHRQGGEKRPTERGDAGAALVMKTGVELDRNVKFGYGD